MNDRIRQEKYYEEKQEADTLDNAYGDICCAAHRHTGDYRADRHITDHRFARQYDTDCFGDDLRRILRPYCGRHIANLCKARGNWSSVDIDPIYRSRELRPDTDMVFRRP